MIKRRLYDELFSHVKEKEITLLTGPRQAGKTTLLKLISAELEKKRVATLWLNLDLEKDYAYFSSQESLLKKIRLEFGDNYGVVFIDEIQRKENAGLFLKGIFDSDISAKLVVSGSGSIELREKIQESLAGRKRLFELSTVDFWEYIDYQTNYRYSDRIIEYFELEQDQAFRYLNEYLGYGGYPRVVTETRHAEKHLFIEEIYRSYIEKDLLWLMKADNIQAFSQLTKILAAQTGMLMNYNLLASQCGLSVPTVKKYLWYAEKTFIINILSPYFNNRIKEYTKAGTVYFTDIGLKNYSTGLFGTADKVINYAGFNFQNLIFNILKFKYRHTAATIHYWRTNDGAEVDFIIRYADKIIPVEVKYVDIKNNVIGRSLHSFITRYNPEKAYIVNLGNRKTIQVDNTEVNFIPYYLLLSNELL